MLWLAVLSSLLFGLVYVLCYLYSGNALASFMGGLCAWFFGTVSMALRPLLLGHIFLVVDLIVLELAARDRRWLWRTTSCSPFGSCPAPSSSAGVLFLLRLLGRRPVGAGCGGADRPATARLSSPFWPSAPSRFAIRSVSVLLPTQGPGTTVHQHECHRRMAFRRTRSSRGLGLIAAMLAVFLVPCAARVRLQELLLVTVSFGLAILHARMLFVFGIAVSPICRLVSPLIEERRDRDPSRRHCPLYLRFSRRWAFNSVRFRSKSAGQSVGALTHIQRSGLSGDAERVRVRPT
jgi:hypothetical protein